MGTPTATLAAYLQEHLDKRQWTRADLARASGLAESGLARWMAGKAPSLENCRVLADVLGRPLLEVLVAAGILTPDEAGHKFVEPNLSALTNDELLGEVKRRMLVSHAPTADEIAADRDRYTPIGESQTTPKKRRLGP